MNTKYGFIQMSSAEFASWLTGQRVARTVLFIQQHHTYSPDYGRFTGSNHFELQRNMKDYHLNHNGWSDLGQHFTTFPDGTILTGRSLEWSPAGIYMNNANAICLEHLGDFDGGRDLMTAGHQDTIIRMTAALCSRFSIPVNTDRIVYHHWFNLDNGARNNGTSNNKTCPGTNFFGGNKVADCQQNFLPLVSAIIGGALPPGPIVDADKYVCVTANTLNIRIKPDSASPMAPDRQPAKLGAILRIFKADNGWLKISNSQEHWVSGRYTREVTRATVKADTLNIRSGPGTSFPVVSSLLEGQEIFISVDENGWCRISMDEKWVKKDFLEF